jgi:acetolactate synthase-1/3 small subunit
MKKQCMVVFVENNAGVLARVSSLFVQRGFNIDSLTVSPTENEAVSRITIMTHGDEKFFSQILKQTGKLIETKMIFTVEPMVNEGKAKFFIDIKDGWTVRTADGGLSAQVEHEILVTEQGIEILSR